MFDTIDVKEDIVEAEKKELKPSWKKASDCDRSKYCSMLEQKLNQINIPSSITSCRDVKCSDENHKDEADILMEQVLLTVQVVAEKCLPCPKGSEEKVKSMPGWNESVKPHRDIAFFWHQVWQSAGRPLNTGLHQIMKKTRNVFHMQTRKCRKAEEQIKNPAYGRH